MSSQWSRLIGAQLFISFVDDYGKCWSVSDEELETDTEDLEGMISAGSRQHAECFVRSTILVFWGFRMTKSVSG